MMYLTYSEGFRSGGITSGAEDTDGDGIEEVNVFEPEKVKNSEIGVKLDAFNRRLRANMAAYYTEYTDIQVTNIRLNTGVPVPFIENAGKAIITGFEGEFTVIPTERLRLMATVSYTDADFKEYDVDVTIIDPNTGVSNFFPNFDRSDEPMARVPEWTAFLSADYMIPLGSWGTLTPSVAVRYTTEIYNGFDRDSFVFARDQITSEEEAFLDARLTWRSRQESVQVTLWGRNLDGADDDYFVGGIPLVSVSGGAGLIYQNPRTYGLDVRYRFGDG